MGPKKLKYLDLGKKTEFEILIIQKDKHLRGRAIRTKQISTKFDTVNKMVWYLNLGPYIVLLSRKDKKSDHAKIVKTKISPFWVSSRSDNLSKGLFKYSVITLGVGGSSQSIIIDYNFQKGWSRNITVLQENGVEIVSFTFKKQF